MRIVLASSEAVPYSKTGGLADVTSALAKSLAGSGHNVTLVVPHYPQLQRQNGKRPLASTGQPLQIWLGGKIVTANLYWGTLPGSDVTVLFVDQPDFFDRPALYGNKDGDYQDNCARFCFFSRAVMEACRTLVLRPDIIHANDWQTGLIPALLEAEYRDQPGFENTSSVFTIHNLAYQGQFWHWDYNLTGLDWKYFNAEQMEHWGGLNLLKTGISFSDMVTTVSPTYAYEITTPLGGMGLDGILSRRSGDLVGILNGIDPDEWNPATDEHLPANYDAKTVFEIKPQCKAALQQELNLEVRPDVPLFGMVSRMADQKGFDLVATAAEEMLKLDAQFCFLGSGDPRYEALVRHLANTYHGRVAATVGFDNGLAHRIEAGSDAFLMPSRFEPCGLNQMYSLAYGTAPIVRSVGGLKDTVVDASPKNLFLGAATGFRFEDYDAAGLLWAVRRAAEMYPKKNLWQQLIRSGMSQDFSWGKSAGRYVEVYERVRGIGGGGGSGGR
ncbi:MAG: glycogen synthase GlgA [Planctomycetaceae bacterium]|nr:glycogen synthase GlgA [Planctomycetaceae bacterium]